MNVMQCSNEIGETLPLSSKMDITKLSYEELCDLQQKVVSEMNRRENEIRNKLWDKVLEALREYAENVEPITFLLPNDETATFYKKDIENIGESYGVIDTTI